jgi:hypothetical protein
MKLVIVFVAKSKALYLYFVEQLETTDFAIVILIPECLSQQGFYYIPNVRQNFEEF